MLKDLKIETVEKVNDSTYKAIHTFTNPMFNKEIRLTRNYIFTADLDSIKSKVEIKSEMKSKDEWIDMDF